jgi:hypothetical protein
MKFGDIIVPARTKCRIINKPDIFTADASGVQISVVVDNYYINADNKENENKVIKYRYNVNNASLCGILIGTNTQSVYMDAGDKMYWDYGLYDWQLEKIFGKDNVPKNLLKGKYVYYGKDAKLQDVIEYLEEEFAEWVQENCEFITLTKDDIEDGLGFDGAEEGDNTLSPKGIEQFETKLLEYQNRLETTGFTYDFRGGLIWD